MKTPYDVLEISEKASEAEIKSAFRRLAKAYHPDVNNGVQNSKEIFQEVAEAYATLSDPIAKEYWDEEIKNNFSGLSNSKKDFEKFHDIKATAEDIRDYINGINEEIRPYKEIAKRTAMIGMAWLVGGLVVTLGTYMAAVNSGGGTYVITWGAILFGGIQAIRSIISYSKISDAINKFEKEMWKVFE